MARQLRTPATTEKRDSAGTKPLFPVVSRLPAGPALELTHTQFEALEEKGGVKLSLEQRKNLNDLAHAWFYDSLRQESARPNDFRAMLNLMIAELDGVRKAVGLNERDASGARRHLVHWLIDHPAGGMELYLKLVALGDKIDPLAGEIDAVRSSIVRLREALPPDEGRIRPFDDRGRLISLADIFEAAGGKAVSYNRESEPGGVANTPFRRFTHKFYSLIPLKRHRLAGGLDTALREALSARRRIRKKG